MVIRYENYKAGQISGTATVVDSKRIEGRKNPIQTRLLHLGSIVRKISSKEGIFANYEGGVFGYKIDGGRYEVNINDYEELKGVEFTQNINRCFGPSYVLTELLKKQGYLTLINDLFTDENEKKLFTALVYYEFCGHPDREDLTTFLERDILGCIFNGLKVSSQLISALLAKIGKPEFKSEFMNKYLAITLKDTNEKIACDIDSTNLNTTCNTELKQYTTHGSQSSEQIRMIVVMERTTMRPIWYKLIPGNQLDKKTLYEVIDELNLLEIKLSEIIIDAGYYSIENVELLNNCKIEFITRLGTNLKVYKDCLPKLKVNQNNSKYDFLLEDRCYCGYRSETTLELHDWNGTSCEKKYFVYTYIDYFKRDSDYSAYLNNHADAPEKEKTDYKFHSGVFMLLSDQQLSPKDILLKYRLRDGIEKIIKYNKSYLRLLPLGKRSIETIEGHALINFFNSAIFVGINNKLLSNNITVKKFLGQLELYTTVVSAGNKISKRYINPKASAIGTMVDVDLSKSISTKVLFSIF